jgi:hypothetical protein
LGDDQGASFIGPLDVGSDEYLPIYSCDDPNAIIPDHVLECMDAIPGIEADEDDRVRVAYEFGRGCGLERVCGDLWGIDCGAASDGPYYYVRAEDLRVLSSSWAAPPKRWNCPLY